MKAALLSGEALLARVLSMAHQCRSMRPRWHIPLTSPLPSQFISLRAFTTSNQLGRNVRVAAARETRFEDPKGCPACGQVCFRPSTYHAHLQRCCPDLLDLSPLISGAIDDAAVDAWLAIAHTQEEGLRARSLEVAFRQFDADGNRLRQGPTEVATALGVSVPRAEGILRAAMRAVPLAADNEPVEVVYEDDDVIALNKPYGVITAPKHRYTGGSLVNRLIGTRGLEPLVIHRLDMNTTGVVLFAKRREVVPALHAQFREKAVRKRYIALVAGVPGWKEREVDAPIGHSTIEKVARTVCPDGKPAFTRFHVTAANTEADLTAGTPAVCAAPGVANLTQGAALVSCEPLTGRTHQIRVHLGHTGHPIVGDDIYGVVGPWLERQALHAATLTLKHPSTGLPLTVTAPLPEDFRAALRALGLGDVDEAEALKQW